MNIWLLRVKTRAGVQSCQIHSSLQEIQLVAVAEFAITSQLIYILRVCDTQMFTAQHAQMIFTIATASYSSTSSPFHSARSKSRACVLMRSVDNASRSVGDVIDKWFWLDMSCNLYHSLCTLCYDKQIAEKRRR